MDNQMLLTKCMELTQYLENSGSRFTLSLRIGEFSFSLDTREKVISVRHKKKGKSPSAQRRNYRRRMEFLRKKGITSSGQPPTSNVSNVSPGNDLDPPRHPGDLEGRKQRHKVIPQLDGISDISYISETEEDKNKDNMRFIALENAVINNNKRIEGDNRRLEALEKALESMEETLDNNNNKGNMRLMALEKNYNRVDKYLSKWFGSDWLEDRGEEEEEEEEEEK